MIRTLFLGTLAFLALTANSASAYFGAIAYSPYSRMTGVSYGQYDLQQAEYVALAECGAGCEVAVWVENSCGALAGGAYQPGFWGYGISPYAATAQSIALEGCAQRDTGCEILASVCAY